MDGYTTKEVLLATKDRLCELEKKLKQLKEMTYINGDKNIKDIRYTIFSTSENEQPELYCNVTWNEKNLKGIIKNLKVRTGLYTFEREKGLVLRDNNGRSYINNHSYSMYIPEKNQKEYGRISSELLDDKFIKGFVKEGLLFAKDNVDMSIVPNSVNIKMLKDYLISFYYYPGEKRAELMAKKGIELSDTLLQEMLNAELKKSNFTDYRKDIMALSFNKDKEIIIPEFKVNDGKIDFEIEEDKKTLYLISKKV